MKRVWIAISVIEKIILEADDKLPLETGGVLAGYCTLEGDDVVISEMLGPGPNAIHSTTSYRPDYPYDREEIGRIYDESNGATTYLGDWHTHPGSTAYLSWTDRRALRNIAKEPRNYMSCPVMLVFQQNQGDSMFSWHPGAWRIIKKTGTNFWTKWEYIPQKVVLY